MRNVLLRRRPDGLPEVIPVGHLRRLGSAFGVTLVSVPVVLALVAVLPVLALAIPSLPLVGAFLWLLRLWNHGCRHDDGLTRLAPAAMRRGTRAVTPGPR